MIVRQDGSYVELDYDAALRLAEERHFNSGSVLQQTITYSYDAAGNRTSKRATGPGYDDTYTENIDPISGYKLAGVTATNGDNSSFGYDAGGRLITIGRDNDTQTLTYNAAGQVTGVLNVGGANVDYTYEYDALGRRTVATDSTGGEQRYLIAPAAQRLGAGVLDVEVQHLAANGSGGLLAGWVFAGENPILRFSGAQGSEQIEYYLEDGSDSVAALVDEMASLVAEYRYDGFGNNLDDMLYEDPGSGASAIAGLNGDFGFQAAWRETETGLYNMRARTYDPETGRFTSPDQATPSEQAPETYNPYTFANNNPVLFSDPTGLFSVSEISVSSSIQSSLNGLRSAVLQKAKEFAVDEITEFAVDFIVDQFALLLPSFGLPDVRKFLNGKGAALDFQNFVNSMLEEVVPLPDSLWIEPTILANGKVTRAHKFEFNTQADLDDGQFRGRRSMPDFLINPENPRENSDSRTWLVGDIKLTSGNLLRDYVSPANKPNQWKAIINHSRRYGINISLFITLKDDIPGTTELFKAKIGKKALRNGVIAFVINLLD